MEKDRKFELEIEDISSEGSGIGHFEGMAVFVDGTVPGDKVTVRADKVKKNYAIASLVSIDEQSDIRITPDCRYFADGICGGCAFRNIKYEAELKIKEKQVRDKLVRLAGIENPDLKPIIGMAEPDRYRNKAQFQIAEGRVGFYARATHSVADIDDCMLQQRAALAVSDAVSRFMREENVPAFDPKTGDGVLRHVIVKTATGTDEVMVVIVASTEDVPKLDVLAGMLDDAVYEAGMSLESIAVNVNSGRTQKITGDKYKTVAGKPTILSECCGLKFEISPSAFYQVNPVQTEVLYGKAIEYAELKGDETVFDLYCGVGTIGIIAADRLRKSGSGRTYGIEIDRGAVIDANRNAVINGIVNAEFLCGPAEEKIDELVNGYTDRDGFEIPGKKPDVIIIDPPKSGCDSRLIDTILELCPERVIYVSCDAATMARDIKSLSSGYVLSEATPVDMFPRCNNVETVCKLVRRKHNGEV